MTDTELIGGEEPSRHNRIAPPVAAGSVDTPVFQELLTNYFNAQYATFRASSAAAFGKATKAEKELLDHIDAWGEQQREQGKAEQTAFLTECLSRDTAEFNRKWTEQKDRAEKAEASLKELEASRQALQAEGKHPAPCARDCEAQAFKIEVRRLTAESAHKQSIIDRLMLEYCPDEMTAEQVKEWGEHQVRAEVQHHPV